jgi:urease accessory protein
MRLKISIAGAVLAMTAVPALAHPGASHAAGFVHGIAHPLSGVDHILAMVAVGLVAARIGGKALWLVPGAFLAMMALGGILGVAGLAVPFVEAAIAASVVVLGFMAVVSVRLPIAAVMSLAGAFALFHGVAHGIEMPADASGLAYGLGFVAATAMLHATGIGAGFTLARRKAATLT